MWFVEKSRRRDFVPRSAWTLAGSNLREKEVLLLAMMEIRRFQAETRGFAPVGIREPFIGAAVGDLRVR
jgi:hypothetical protein